MRTRREVVGAAGGARRAVGFTLIEILLAMMIFLSGITGICALLATGLALQRDGLEAGQTSRRVEEVLGVLERELSAGGHWDEAAGAWRDVERARLEDGLFYRVRWLEPRGTPSEGVLLAEIRIATKEVGLERAPAIRWALSTGPLPADAVRRWRRPPVP